MFVRSNAEEGDDTSSSEEDSSSTRKKRRHLNSGIVASENERSQGKKTKEQHSIDNPRSEPTEIDNDLFVSCTESDIERKHEADLEYFIPNRIWLQPHQISSEEEDEGEREVIDQKPSIVPYDNPVSVNYFIVLSSDSDEEEVEKEVDVKPILQPYDDPVSVNFSIVISSDSETDD